MFKDIWVLFDKFGSKWSLGYLLPVLPAAAWRELVPDCSTLEWEHPKQGVIMVLDRLSMLACMRRAKASSWWIIFPWVRSCLPSGESHDRDMALPSWSAVSLLNCTSTTALPFFFVRLLCVTSKKIITGFLSCWFLAIDALKGLQSPYSAFLLDCFSLPLWCPVSTVLLLRSVWFLP